MNLSNKTKSELIEELNKLIEQLALKNRIIQSFKEYDSDRSRKVTKLELKLAQVTEHRNTLDAQLSQQLRIAESLKSEISKLSTTNLKLNDEVEELLIQVYGDEYDSDAIKFDEKIKANLLKPVDRCITLRAELNSLTSDSDKYYNNKLAYLADELAKVKKEKNTLYAETCDLRSIINASNDASKIDNCIKAITARYQAELTKRNNEVNSLNAQINKLKNKLAEYETKVQLANSN